MKVVTKIALAVLVVALTAGVTVTLTRHSDAAPPAPADPTAFATVARQPISAQTQVNATLGYAGSYSAVNQAQGTITQLPSVGKVMHQGDVLYWVNGQPVFLLYGRVPAYRSLAEGSSAASVKGPDVAELNADLVALGYASYSQIPRGSTEFSWWTKYALELMERHYGLTVTGTLPMGRAVFMPGAARISAVSATLGQQAQPGQPILTATGSVRQVTVQLSTDLQPNVKAGDHVAITLPSGRVTTGVVTYVGSVATVSGSGSPTVTVQVRPLDPKATGNLDHAQVQVAITTAKAADALVVPVNALLAVSGGGYAVEEVGRGGRHHLITVSVGLFNDASGLVQVTGSGLAAGQRVVVPGS